MPSHLQLENDLQFFRFKHLQIAKLSLLIFVLSFSFETFWEGRYQSFSSSHVWLDVSMQSPKPDCAESQSCLSGSPLLLWSWLRMVSFWRLCGLRSTALRLPHTLPLLSAPLTHQTSGRSSLLKAALIRTRRWARTEVPWYHLLAVSVLSGY